MGPLDLNAILQAGAAAVDATHAEAESAKLGTLRGGSAGIVLDDGTQLGKCARLAALRSKGHQPPIPTDRRSMFAAGFKSEEIVLDWLAAGLPTGHTVRHGDAVAFTVTRPDGVVLSCRPDGVVYQGDTPELGLEFKMVSSLWTMIGTCYDLRPKSDHLIQAALYSYHLGKLPWALVYSQRVEFHISTAPKFIQEKFAPGLPTVEYKSGKPFKCLPQDRVYYLDWGPDGDTFGYWTEGMDAPCPTAITGAALDRYGDLVVAALQNPLLLPSRPGEGSVDGSKSFNPCDYCDLAEVCTKYESQPKAWWDHAARLCSSGRTGREGAK